MPSSWCYLSSNYLSFLLLSLYIKKEEEGEEDEISVLFVNKK